MSEKSSSFAESPWFWLMLFSGMAWLGLWAISSKYEVRERRIEMKTIGREEANQRIARGEAVDPTRTVGAPQQAARPVLSRDDDVLVYPEQFENQKSLGFLKWAALVIVVFAWVMLVVTQYQRRRQQFAATVLVESSGSKQ